MRNEELKKFDYTKLQTILDEDDNLSQKQLAAMLHVAQQIISDLRDQLWEKSKGLLNGCSMLCLKDRWKTAKTHVTFNFKGTRGS